MEDSLRFLVEESLLKYITFLETQLSPVVEVRSTNDVEQMDPKLDVISSKKPPLFAPRSVTVYDRARPILN
eukprot:22071-Prorocentrum_minimum.AAC.3